MRPRRYSSEAIVLARRNYSEADRILTVVSQHYGKLVLMAKGVRKPISRKRGSIEVFSKIKFSAARGRIFDIVTEVEMLRFYKDIRNDLKKVSLAYYFIEVVDKIIQQEEKNGEIFTLLNDYLSKLESEKKLKKLKDEFVRRILIISGFWPRQKAINNPNKTLEYVLERKISSARVGKKVLS
jgi:DNA repair protein RecO (recombination protein O)